MDKTLYHCKYPDCDKAFKKPSLLKLHLNTHTDTRPFQCSYCSKAYFKQSHLTAHVLQHTELPSHQCPTCNRSFYTRQKLARHEQTCERVFQCSRCQKVFVRERWYQKHMERHVGRKRESRVNECEYCKQVFASSKSLRIHIKNIHFKIKEYICKCGKSYGYKRLLENHKKSCLEHSQESLGK
ncbi:Zinc finger C2H2 protein [Astathelohania contejeani]|uniref:Zinc finger C2H2 protein n=1 Tax=Astathelohania contejeani TaxID=164912 RepID=A0ABQ7HXG5_9MICR|nr:Zinc finger C2H2 protein [Thelohania contejeani]